MELNAISAGFLVANATLLFFLPRRWALLPLLLTACYMTKNQGVVLGPFHFSAFRVMLLAELFRAVLRGERLNRRLNGLDCLLLAWAGWLLASSLFSEDAWQAAVYRLGIVYDVCGIYFLVCLFCQSLDDLLDLCKITAIVLVPVSVAMLSEKLTAFNFFSQLGGLDAVPYIRQGNVRASGPFAHAILAGTVGAVCLPLTVLLWPRSRTISLAGTVACLVMVYASASSGPVMSTVAAASALLLWRFRQATSVVIWSLIFGLIALYFVMEDPPYYILARIDISGGSTGWYRARLIQSSIEHLSEWWIAGTDYTRHWMATGLISTPGQADITNHYLQNGVWGGVPLLLLFVVQLGTGFSYVGKTVRRWSALAVPAPFVFVVWALGASLFAHAVTCVAVSYFDQSYIFLYMTLAAISATQSARRPSMKKTRPRSEGRGEGGAGSGDEYLECRGGSETRSA